jgi:hypothetical protein
LVEAVVGVFYGVVQQRGGKRHRPDTEFCENSGNFKRVGDVRLARLSGLRSVRQLGNNEGTIDDRKVGLRVVEFCQSQNLVEF